MGDCSEESLALAVADAEDVSLVCFGHSVVERVGGCDVEGGGCQAQTEALDPLAGADGSGVGPERIACVSAGVTLMLKCALVP